MSMLNEIKSLVKNPISFETPVKVKATPHSPVVNVYSIEKTPAGDVWVRVSEEINGFVQLEEKDDQKVIGSILQRLKLMELKNQL